MRLTDKQWEMIHDLVPDGAVRSDGKGRPWRDKYEVLEGILWLVITGARWRDFPKDYPPYQIRHPRFQTKMENRTLFCLGILTTEAMGMI